MESRLQNKNAKDDTTGGTQQNENNKRSPMTLNVSGLWDVVPRMDHYRYLYKVQSAKVLILIFNIIYYYYVGICK